MNVKHKILTSLIIGVAMSVGFYACSGDESSEVANENIDVLKSTSDGDADSLMFIRDPSGSTVGAFRMYGINFTSDTYTGLTDTLSTGNASLGCELYFYNEKVYTSNTQLVSAATGCPALFLGEGVTGYKTSKNGSIAFNAFTADSIDYDQTLLEDAAATLSFPIGSPYRYDSGRLIRSYVKDTYYPSFLIGNTFQGLASSSQPIYVINIGNYYYAFMVSRFQNGTTTTGVAETDKQYITLKYKLLN